MTSGAVQQCARAQGAASARAAHAAILPPTRPTDTPATIPGTEVLASGYALPHTQRLVVKDPADVDTDNAASRRRRDTLRGNPAVQTGRRSRTQTARSPRPGGDSRLEVTVGAQHHPGLEGVMVTCTATIRRLHRCGGVARPPIPGGNRTERHRRRRSHRRKRCAERPHPSLSTRRRRIRDYDEVNGTNVLPFDDQPRVTNPRDADSDNDTLSDGAELLTGWTVTLQGVSRTVFSDPLNADLDGDGLPDALERTTGTDPNDPDTDGDGATDKLEYDRNQDADANNDTDPLVRDQLLRFQTISGCAHDHNNIS